MVEQGSSFADFEAINSGFTSEQPHNIESIVSPHVISVAFAIKEKGGRALLVGGGVRDFLNGSKPKDFDIEVYQLEADLVEKAVIPFGKVSSVGKSFGILKVSNPNGLDLDISLPRIDSKIGIGHRGFEVKVDPFMSIEDAARRRDFTINSMAMDPLTGEILDPHGGFDDLKNKVLRVTDNERFMDDPLRVMRALQFAGRFNLSVEKESFELMAQMVPTLAELPKERLLEEWKKMLLKSEKPSVGLKLGMELGIFHELHPDFVSMLNTPQEAQWHPEGDVWTHTLMAVDQAAKIIRSQNLNEEEAWTLMLATICHDLGKPETTEFNEEGKIVSYGHDKEGVEPTLKFLKRIGVDLATTEKVAKLVENHMWSHTNYSNFTKGQDVSDGAFRKLARNLYPATIEELARLGYADGTGTGYYGTLKNLSFPKTYPESEWLLARADNVGVGQEKPVDVILGRDLIEMGYKPGRKFGEVIQLANALRDDKGYSRENLISFMQNHTHIDDLISAMTSL